MEVKEYFIFSVQYLLCPMEYFISYPLAPTLPWNHGVPSGQGLLFIFCVSFIMEYFISMPFAPTLPWPHVPGQGVLYILKVGEYFINQCGVLYNPSLRIHINSQSYPISFLFNVIILDVLYPWIHIFWTIPLKSRFFYK